jgi:hypothetical protein
LTIVSVRLFGQFLAVQQRSVWPLALSRPSRRPIRRTTSSCFDSIDRVYVETPIPTHPKAGDLHFVSQTVNRRRMYAQIFRDFLNGQNLRRGWGDAELL